MPPRKLVVATAIFLILVGFGIYYSVSEIGLKPVTESIDITIPGGDTAAAELSPQNFTVMEGQKVTLVINNMDNSPHFLYISALGVNTEIIQSGQTATVSFVPNKVGVFPLWQPPMTGPCATYSTCNVNQGYVTVTAR
jgi:uncharacterized cupredoxin-like copper-binding protein